VVVGTSVGQLFTFDYSSSLAGNFTSFGGGKVTVLLKLSSGLLVIGYDNNMYQVKRNQTANSFVCDGSVSGPVMGLTEGHDGLLIVASSNNSGPSRLSFWNSANCSLSSAKEEITILTSIVAVQTAVCPDNVNCMLVAETVRYVDVYNYDSQLSITQIAFTEITTMTAMAVVGIMVVSGDISGVICAYNMSSTEYICFTGHSQSVLSIQKTNTLTFATLGSERMVMLWNVVTPPSPCTSYANLSVAVGAAANVATNMAYLSSSNQITVTYVGGYLLMISLWSNNSIQTFNLYGSLPYDLTAVVQYTIPSIWIFFY
jgi:WD40 repeat protein